MSEPPAFDATSFSMMLDQHISRIAESERNKHAQEAVELKIPVTSARLARHETRDKNLDLARNTERYWSIEGAIFQGIDIVYCFLTADKYIE